MKKAALSRSCCRIFNDGLFSFPSLNRIDDIADFPKPLGHASGSDLNSAMPLRPPAI
jgi:hypothetical protein